MGKGAFGTTLDVAGFADIPEVSPTTVPQQVKRAIAKQAIEGSSLDIFVAWKKSTFPVFKEFFAVHRTYIIGFPHWIMSS